MKTIFKVKFLITSFLLFTFSSIFAHFNPVRTGNGQFGGTPTVFAVDPVYGYLYFGSAQGGVFYGQVAQPTTITSWVYRDLSVGGMTSGKITSLTFYGSTNTVTGGAKVIAGTADAGVFISRDKGSHWAQSSFGNANVSQINALITGNNVVLVGTNNGIYISSDSAKTFSAVTTQPFNTTITSFSFFATKIYAGTNGGGVFVSSDNGATWIAANTSLSGSSLFVKSFFVVNGSTVYVATSGGVYSSATSNIAWSSANTGLENVTVTGFSAKSSSNLFAATNNGVYTTTNSGVSWTSANTGFTGLVNAISPAVFSGSIYIGVNSDGIYKSDATNIAWNLFNTGFTNVASYAVLTYKNFILSSTEKGVYVSTDNATSYVLGISQGISDDKNVSSFAFDGNSTFFAGTKSGYLYTTVQNPLSVTGLTSLVWTQVGNAFESGASIKKIAVAGNNILVALNNGHIYSSIIGTYNWILGSGLGSNFVVSDLATDGVNIFAASTNKGVYLSTDAQTWKAYNTGLSNTNVTSLAVAGSNVYAGTAGSGVFTTSVTTCPSWAAFNTSLASLNITALAASGKWIVAGFRGGVNSITVGGTAWGAPTNDNIPAYADINAMSFTYFGTSKILVTTPYNSVYANSGTELKTNYLSSTSFTAFSATDSLNALALNKTVCSCATLTVTSIFGTEAESKIAVVLYPNPTETGDFTVSTQESDVVISKISVLNLTGTTLVSQSNENNLTNVTIEAALPKGLYFVCIETNKGKTVRKLLVK